jgi:hypothetical protein
MHISPLFLSASVGRDVSTAGDVLPYRKLSIRC